ncbi:MAG: TetR/AcrR family transcriptional regulator [Ruminococcus sp.]|nr:TetR/AcrR family transcriptional regulator [Ruminococcus sp.]MBR6872375.1 TetR/AcrR family transcriptional regulator [Ruminococcus sp.]
MSNDAKRQNKREELILAGISEISRSGIAGFSMRRAAEQAGLSCAAPARHFGGKQGFIAAIIDYVNGQWRDEQTKILSQCGPTLREQLVEFSLGYIKFLVEKPHFRSILMLKDDSLDSTYQSRGKTTKLTLDLVDKYCDEVGMDEATRLRKFYIVRSLIYGASLMFDNGELPYTEEVLEIVKESIDREFDLP